jgi:ABC-2 type transport system permease protein
MNAFAYAWSAILPLRWYMEVLLGQGARGLPVSDSARPFAALAALAAFYALLALWRLRAVAGRLSRRTAAEELALSADRPGVAGAFAGEWQRVLAIRGAFIVLIGAPLIYGIYYPQPYLNQILRKLPIVVVDADQSELGRRIVETLDASGAVSVVARARTLAAARAVIDSGDAFAAVGIAPGTERDVLKGVTVHIPIYADATYLFIFRSFSSGITTAINTLSSELAAGGARTDGSLDLQPGRGLCELHCPGGFPADPATDSADRRGIPHRHRRDAGPRRGFCQRARARHRAPDYLPAGARALSHCAAPHLRLLDAR